MFMNDLFSAWKIVSEVRQQAALHDGVISSMATNMVMV